MIFQINFVRYLIVKAYFNELKCTYVKYSCMKIIRLNASFINVLPIPNFTVYMPFLFAF